MQASSSSSYSLPGRSSPAAPAALSTDAQAPTTQSTGTPPRGDTLFVDLPMVLEVAENLVSNAARYARDRVTVCVSVAAAGCEVPNVTGETAGQAGRCLVLLVEDDGPGFTSQALGRACDAFFSESKGAEHFGLGLSIARLLCKKHGGSLEIGNSPVGGGCVTAMFPPPGQQPGCPAS